MTNYNNTSTPLPPPSTVGILAMEVYTPRTYVEQSELEQHMGVAAGKYTIGLGQEGLALTGDAEDINSISLTVVHNLLEKYNIDPTSVGRLEVGTETLVDKSKSTKTVLMDLFPHNTDMEGATVVNACYGGTAALLNAFLWCESSAWDGKYAIVVAADIATYAAGPARPTCGCGAVAVLVGRDAPLLFDPRLRATHAAHVWDFYKPNPAVEYPSVDGALSQTCYYQALEDVYNRFRHKMETYHMKVDNNKTNKSSSSSRCFDATTPDYMVFHAPYNKLVQKSFARLFLLDAQRSASEDEKKEDAVVDSSNGSNSNNNNNNNNTDNNNTDNNNTAPSLEPWLHVPLSDTYNDKTLEKTLKQLSAKAFQEQMTDANVASQKVGNTYTASVFLGLASLVDRRWEQLTAGKFICLFSYGSGALATMYGLQVRTPTTQTKFTIATMAQAMKLTERLATQREKVEAVELDRALDARARMHTVGAPYQTVYPPERLFPGTYYLQSMDQQWRRTYMRYMPEKNDNNNKQPPLESTTSTLAPPTVLLAERQAKLERATTLPQRHGGGGPPHVSCLVTGISAGLPGRTRDAVFGPDSIAALVRGDNCIEPVSETTQQAMLEKNIVQVQKQCNNTKTTTTAIPLKEQKDMIQLAAQINTDAFDLTNSYGVPATLAKTMDMASQLAVAAGMEALASAGLVSGRQHSHSNAEEWKVPEEYRDTTAIIYASSFPAMDAAVGEVMRFLQSQKAQAAAFVSSLKDRVVESSSAEWTEQDQAQLAALSQNCGDPDYTFDRKFLFRVLVLANAQLAQLAGIRGPNTQTNAACAGTTQAMAMAQDMLITGRAERVVVIAGDNAAGDVLLPWLGSGFRVLGAATNKCSVEEAAVPFDKRRSGMLLGSGGCGLVVESAASVAKRQLAMSSSLREFQPQARLLATQYSNSAYHGAALDSDHLASELVRFLTHVETTYGITREEICRHGVYFSHETCTHASKESSCAGNEVSILRHAFGQELLEELLILNTKGFTGHPMGVSFEDVAAVAVLQHQQVPAMPNYQVEDDYLGPLKLSKGGDYPCKYALRFAAGFGSQAAFALYGTMDS